MQHQVVLQPVTIRVQGTQIALNFRIAVVCAGQVYQVRSGLEVDDHVVARHTRAERVGALTACVLVVSAAADHRVFAVAAEEVVDAAGCRENVIAILAKQKIVTLTAC